MPALDFTSDLWRTLAFVLVSWQPLARPFMIIDTHGTSDLVEASIRLRLSGLVCGLPRVGWLLLIGECAFCSKDSLAGVPPDAKMLINDLYLGGSVVGAMSVTDLDTALQPGFLWLGHLSQPQISFSLLVYRQHGLTFLCAACAPATDSTQLLHTNLWGASQQSSFLFALTPRSQILQLLWKLPLAPPSQQYPWVLLRTHLSSFKQEPVSRTKTCAVTGFHHASSSATTASPLPENSCLGYFVTSSQLSDGRRPCRAPVTKSCLGAESSS